MNTTRILRDVATLLIMGGVVVGRSFAGECTENEAYNKMMALGRAQGRIMSSSATRGMEIAEATAAVGQKLADKKFGEACEAYDGVAKKFGIDLAKEQQGMVTMEQLVKDGGKNGGECSLADASRKMMEMHQQLEDQAALGDVDRDVFRRFGADTEKLNDFLYTNPSEACRQLELLKPKYHLK